MNTVRQQLHQAYCFANRVVAGGLQTMPSSHLHSIPEDPRSKELHVKTTQYLWMKRLAAGAAVIALPLAVMAQGPVGEVPKGCPSTPRTGRPIILLPLGMFPELPPPGALPIAPYPRGLKLTEVQQDKPS
jgi:hypothetical protein